MAVCGEHLERPERATADVHGVLQRQGLQPHHWLATQGLQRPAVQVPQEASERSDHRGGSEVDAAGDEVVVRLLVGRCLCRQLDGQHAVAAAVGPVVSGRLQLEPGLVVGPGVVSQELGQGG